MKKMIEKMKTTKINEIIQECSHNNRILITCAIINLLIGCIFFVNPLRFPDSIKPTVSGKTTLFSKDTVLTQEFTSNIDDLKSVSIAIITLSNKNNKGEIYYSIYDSKNNKIFSDAIKAKDIYYHPLLEMNFENQKNSKNKKYYVEFHIKNIDEKNAIYFNTTDNNQEPDINIDDKNLNISIAIDQMGDSKTYIPAIVFAIIFMYNLILLFKNNLNKIKISNKTLVVCSYFIFWSILCFLLFKILYSYNYYDNYISIIYTIVFILLLIILAFFATIILYENKNRNRIKIENIFLTIAIPISLLYSMFVLYGNVPDEIAHYNRAYQVSNLEIIKINDSKIPEIIANRKSSYFGIIESYKRQDEKEKLVKTDYTGANLYNPILYIPTSIMIKIGNIFHIPVVYTFYFARVFNLLIFISLGYFSIKLIPFGKLLLLIYMMNPMLLQQAASISVDSIINSMVIMFASYVFYLKNSDNPLNVKNVLILLLLSLYVLVGKYAYFPILLLLLLLWGNIRRMNKKNKIIMLIGMILIGTYFTLSFLYMKRPPQDVILNMNFSQAYDSIKINNSSIANIIGNPIRYIMVLFNTLRYSGTFFIYSFVGGFPGSLEFQIFPYISIIYLFVLLISPFVAKEKRELSKSAKIILWIIFLIVLNIIFYAFYDALTLMNDVNIGGIQGRYFIPIAILPLLALIKKDKYVVLKNNKLIYSLLIFVNLITLYEIFKFYL